MRKILSCLCIGIALTGCARNTYIGPIASSPEGAEPLYVDLAEDTTSTSITVPPGRYDVHFLNRMPNKRYVVRGIVRNIPVPPLELPSKPTPAAPTHALGAGCLHVTAARTHLQRATSEKEVAVAVRQLTEAAVQESTDECVVMAQTSIASTRVSGGVYTIDTGQELLLTAQRFDALTPGPTWTRVFATGARGEWRTTYGFTFVGRAINAQRFFTEDSAGTFVVKRMHRRPAFDYVPSLFFNWMPSEDETRTMSYGLTAGLGFDFSNVAVMLGGAATYNQNITVSAGIAFNQQQRLLGQYEEGQTVGSSLTEAQLHDRHFVPNPYIAVSVRSITSPFDRR